MKVRFRTLLTASVAAVTFALSGGSASAQTCQPGIGPAFAGPHGPQYIALATAMGPQVPALTAQLAAVVDQATYETLLDTANALAAIVVPAGSGRVLITLPDGTVVLDTARADDVPGDPTSNSFANFQAKTINENHNSRVAIFMAQEYPCGAAVESKSTWQSARATTSTAQAR
jgi:hypothetical protein